MSETEGTAVSDGRRDESARASRPQPERDEPKVADPTPGDLSKRDFLAILVRAGKDSLKDRITNSRPLSRTTHSSRFRR